MTIRSHPNMKLSSITILLSSTNSSPDNFNVSFVGLRILSDEANREIFFRSNNER